MAEPREIEGELEPGLYTKKGKAFDADKVSPDKLSEVSQKKGIDFVYDGDKNTFTPERFVVIPKKKS